MFDLLKKKLNSFTEKVKKRIEKEETVSVPEEKKAIEKKPEPIKEKAIVEELPEASEPEEKEIKEPEIEPVEEIKEAEEKAVAEPEEIQEPVIEPEAVEPVKVKAIEVERKPEAKISVKSRFKKFVRGKFEIKEEDIESFLEELELALLESDVEQETSEEIVSKIKQRLVGKEVKRGKDVSQTLREEIREILLEVMETEKIELFELMKKKPFTVLFLGPNGAGKTTSIAKLTNLLQKKGKSVIWAASDTFRAASIEQLEKHASKLGVRVVKHSYGADPTAVAFDAVKAAEAAKIDVVLIDSAGRQETNKNLLNELEKIKRVIQPDLKLFVGEAMAGNSLLEQAKQFNKWIGIDGFILTKIDTDAKGGTAISLLYQLKKPILFIGTGQEYEDFMEFSPEFIVERVVG